MGTTLLLARLDTIDLCSAPSFAGNQLQTGINCLRQHSGRVNTAITEFLRTHENIQSIYSVVLNQHINI